MSGGYISLELSTGAALDRRPISTSFTLTLVSCQGKNHTNSLTAHTQYFFVKSEIHLIFLQTASPRFTMNTHTYICVCIFIYIKHSSCTREDGTYILNNNKYISLTSMKKLRKGQHCGKVG